MKYIVVVLITILIWQLFQGIITIITKNDEEKTGIVFFGIWIFVYLLYLEIITKINSKKEKTKDDKLL